MYSKAKLMGYAIHPMLVGFPVSFYAAAFLAYVAAACTDSQFWFQLAVVSNLAGVATALAAAVPGFIDWAFGVPGGHPAKTTGLQHMILNVGALVFFAVDGGIQLGQWNEPHPSLFAAIGLSAVGGALTLTAAFLGSKLVEKLHVGVELTPEQARLDIVRMARRDPPREDT